MQVLIKMDPVCLDNDVKCLRKVCDQVDRSIRNITSS